MNLVLASCFVLHEVRETLEPQDSRKVSLCTYVHKLTFHNYVAYVVDVLANYGSPILRSDRNYSIIGSGPNYSMQSGKKDTEKNQKRKTKCRVKSLKEPSGAIMLHFRGV